MRKIILQNKNMKIPEKLYLDKRKALFLFGDVNRR